MSAMTAASASASSVAIGRSAGRGAAWLVSSSAGALLVLGAGAGLSYVAQLVTARTIGPDSFGVFAYVLAWLTLAAYVSTLGFHTSLLRLLPAYEARADWSLAVGVARCALVVAILVGAALGAATIFASDLLSRGNSEMKLAFGIGALAIPLIAIQLVVSAGVRAFGGPVLALLPERILRDGGVLFVVATAGWVGLFRPDAMLAVGGLLAGCALALLFAIATFRILRPAAFGEASPSRLMREWFTPIASLTVILAADNLMTRSGVLALGLMDNVRDAGLFAVAFSLALLTALPRMAIASAFAPRVASLYALGDTGELQVLVARSAALSLAATVLLAVPLLAAAPMLLEWFGQSFAEVTPVVTILVAGQVFAAACGPQQHLLTMTGHERACAAVFLASAVVNLAACLIMIRFFGLLGAALGTAAATVVFNLAIALAVARYLRLPPGLVIAVRHFTGRRKR